jgi:acyl carrier protein
VRSFPIPSSLRFIRSGAAPLPLHLLDELERVFGVPVIQGYGMTEAASQIASNPLPPLMRKPGSIGLPAGPEMAVLDASGQILGPGQTGEIVVRGPNVMAGYEADPEANASAFIAGWFRTGDQGYYDTDGYYFLTGRLNELINRGGHKIAPREIDLALQDHPSVAEVATFGVPDARLGQAVAAAVVLHRDHTLTERDLTEFAACRLAYFKVPDRIFFLPELPKGPTGKVRRTGLADHLGVVDGLPSEPQDGTSGDVNDEPEELVMSQVVKTAAEVLGVPEVDPLRSFLESGGDSIRAMLLVARLSNAFEVGLTLLDVFRAPSLVAVAHTITVRVLAQVESSEVNS